MEGGPNLPPGNFKFIDIKYRHVSSFFKVGGADLTIKQQNYKNKTRQIGIITKILICWVGKRIPYFQFNFSCFQKKLRGGYNIYFTARIRGRFPTSTPMLRVCNTHQNPPPPKKKTTNLYTHYPRDKLLDPRM